LVVEFQGRLMVSQQGIDNGMKHNELILLHSAVIASIRIAHAKLWNKWFANAMLNDNMAQDQSNLLLVNHLSQQKSLISLLSAAWPS